MPDSQRLLDILTGNSEGNFEKAWHEVRSDFAKKINDQISEIGYFAKPLQYAIEMEF